MWCATSSSVSLSSRMEYLASRSSDTVNSATAKGAGANRPRLFRTWIRPRARGRTRIYGSPRTLAKPIPDRGKVPKPHLLYGWSSHGGTLQTSI